MPNAPAPTYDSHGNSVSPWRVILTYDPVTDQTLLVAHQEEGAYHQAKTWHDSFGPLDTEDAIASAQRFVRIFSARRLF